MPTPAKETAAESTIVPKAKLKRLKTGKSLRVVRVTPSFTVVKYFGAVKEVRVRTRNLSNPDLYVVTS